MGRTKVTNLPDLSMLTSLKVLSMEGLGLTQVPTIFLKLQLHQLFLGNNKIQKFENLNNQSELVVLSLANNEITAISDIDDLDKL